MPDDSGIHDHSVFKLGKAQKKTDAKTVKLVDFVNIGAVKYPTKFAFDHGRRPFPENTWGNLRWGCCVVAARANQLLRMERVETRRTLALTDDHVIALYKAMTGCVSPGDANDTGLVMLDTLKAWRGGWSLTLGKTTRDYKIGAFGFVNPSNKELVRASIYLFTGVQFGFALPRSAQAQTSQGFWEYDPNAGADAEAGSWGGHAVLAIAYDENNIYVKSWGKTIRVSNDFVSRYSDESWAAIDQLDTWKKTHGVLDVQKLLDYFASVGINPVP